MLAHRENRGNSESHYVTLEIVDSIERFILETRRDQMKLTNEHVHTLPEINERAKRSWKTPGTKVLSNFVINHLRHLSIERRDSPKG